MSTLRSSILALPVAMMSLLRACACACAVGACAGAPTRAAQRVSAPAAGTGMGAARASDVLWSQENAVPESRRMAEALAGQLKAELPDDIAIAATCAAYVELRVILSPEYATSIGRHEHDAELDDRSLAGIARSREQRTAFLRELDIRFVTPRASREALTDLALLRSELRASLALEAQVKPHLRQPDFYTAPMQAVYLMGARDYAAKSERAEAMLKRMIAIRSVVASAKVNLTAPPRIWTQIGIEQAKAASIFFESQRSFLEDALPEQKPRIRTAIDVAKRTYAEYAEFLRATVLPRSNGIFKFGLEAFELQLRERYALHENAAEILALGRRVFADTEQKMATLALKIDPKSEGFSGVLAKFKSNHPQAPQLLAEYRKEVTRARDFLRKNDVVAFPEGDDLEVVDTPPFMRSTVTAAYDQPPPFDRGTKGFFFVTPIDSKVSLAEQEEMLRENDHGDIVDTAVHEAYPGHHLQLSFARKHPSRMRNVTDSAIFSEGWALYSEELMNELGYYTDEERMLQLEWALVRAARILIDVGLHTSTMTFEDAVRLLTDRVHLGRPLALSEVKRYTENPTQPLAYMVGREKIFELRESYRLKRGNQFSLKRFHTELLSHGTIAPGYLEREMFSL
jgi:uncharacterized protein (DUF885 family)